MALLNFVPSSLASRVFTVGSFSLQKKEQHSRSEPDHHRGTTTTSSSSSSSSSLAHRQETLGEILTVSSESNAGDQHKGAILFSRASDAGHGRTQRSTEETKKTRPHSQLPASRLHVDVTGDTTMDAIEGMDDDELIDDSVGDEFDDRVPEVGMVFKNHQEVSKFYKRYARRVGFGIAIRRSAFTEDGHCLYLELMCCKGGRKRPEPKYRKRNSAKTNCPARIKVKLWGDGMLHLVVANIDHNHPVSPSMARFLTCYRQLSGAAKKRADRNKGEIDEPRSPPTMPLDRLSALEELLFSESQHRSFVERACMYGEFPKALITDHFKAIQSAVGQVLPNVRHRLCLSQILKRVPEKLGGSADYRSINKALQKAVYDSLTVDEFEEDWTRMVDIYGLQGNEWIRSLYEFRLSWVPVYLKDTFWAGMSTTQRNETIVAFFDGHVETKTSLKQFLGKYEMALLDKYEKEAQADFETFHKRRPSVSKFYMEEQISRVFTLNMFKKFQDEIEAIMYCHASLLKVDGPISTFDVRECIFLDDGKRTMNKNHGVLYNTEEKEIQCICGSFQFRGILCRHALSVLKLQQVHEIPLRYVINRWKKDFKQLHALAQSSDDVIANNRIDRYDYLSMRCLQLVEVGMLSDKYQLALRLIKEMEKFLLSDNTYDDTQPKIKPRIPKANRLIQNRKLNVGTSMASGNGNAVQQLGGFVQLNEGHPSLGITKATEFQIYMASLTFSWKLCLQQEGGNPAVLPRNQFGMPLNGNQATGGFDPQTFGNGPLMPWIYQPVLQATQNPKDPLAPGPPKRRRKIFRDQKPVESTQDPKEPPVASTG
ncbi:hypothetical protein ZIOFF_020520 [Zingiber officinale]|uniref:Protein FAR1-RELATED SEQUENCE n=1 Tax=Zingiber officinale TaxID=94328 RepID=A0A8J5H6M5_ZINOF|nr:hypothetical protein ZIOFF_020520 [Zingiber officinale]